MYVIVIFFFFTKMVLILWLSTVGYCDASDKHSQKPENVSHETEEKVSSFPGIFFHNRKEYFGKGCANTTKTTHFMIVSLNYIYTHLTLITAHAK